MYQRLCILCSSSVYEELRDAGWLDFESSHVKLRHAACIFKWQSPKILPNCYSNHPAKLGWQTVEFLRFDSDSYENSTKKVN